MPRKKKAPKSSTSRARTEQQTEHQSVARSRRYEAHRSVLSELRRIERHMQPAIPRLPFQRVVRQITAEYNIRFRWTPSALLCLQEALEDWLIEFMEDAYFLSAHAHRLTIMPKDFNTLRIIRHRHEHLLQPILAGDKKMSDILTIPPLHPRRGEGSKASHDRNTRSQATRGNDDVQDPPIITEIPVVPDEVQPVQPEENTQQTNTQQTGRPQQRGRLDREARQRLLTERLLARRLAVADQEVVNRIALEEYMNLPGLRAAFNVAGNREVEPLSREDLGAFVSAENMMNDMSVKVVLW